VVSYNIAPANVKLEPIAGCSKRLRGGTTLNDLNGLNRFGWRRLLSATKPMRPFQQPVKFSV
jgi:hypothetical protein